MPEICDLRRAARSELDTGAPEASGGGSWPTCLTSGQLGRRAAGQEKRRHRRVVISPYDSHQPCTRQPAPGSLHRAACTEQPAPATVAEHGGFTIRRPSFSTIMAHFNQAIHNTTPSTAPPPRMDICLSRLEQEQ
ncbi:hypothetical protein EYF80_049122 [Liparis tanakae]|uniref:Uncharacterized protein n=1 Tax=Liparis tanakae TaxID=230148 RepID=A0A4Z2FID2_9TELE|nr:hypothetical protein EYF80_049122 [Liparis tanakae]